MPLQPGVQRRSDDSGNSAAYQIPKLPGAAQRTFKLKIRGPASPHPRSLCHEGWRSCGADADLDRQELSVTPGGSIAWPCRSMVVSFHPRRAGSVGTRSLPEALKTRHRDKRAQPKCLGVRRATHVGTGPSLGVNASL